MARHVAGEGRLEVRRHGSGPPLPVDLHPGSARRDGGNNPAGADLV